MYNSSIIQVVDFFLKRKKKGGGPKGKELC